MSRRLSDVLRWAVDSMMVGLWLFHKQGMGPDKSTYEYFRQVLVVFGLGSHNLGMQIPVADRRPSPTHVLDEFQRRAGGLRQDCPSQDHRGRLERSRF